MTSGTVPDIVPRALTETGQVAPDFALCDQHGQLVRLDDFAGRANVLVVFYPFAFSGICTKELSEISDHLHAFQSRVVQVLAISCDPMFTLRAWAEQQRFDFPLLSDFWPHGQTAQAYGVFDADNGMAARGSFLVDTAGVVRWSVVNPPGRPRDLQSYLEAVAML